MANYGRFNPDAIRRFFEAAQEQQAHRAGQTHWTPDHIIGVHADTEDERVLRAMTYGASAVFDEMPYAAATATTYVERLVDSGRRLAVKVRADILAEELPPRYVRADWSYTHRFDIDAVVLDPRWASWWDHLKATVRHRWWARAWVRRHPPAAVDTPVRYADVRMVSCRHEVEVPVRDHWAYPHASIPVPGSFGPAVYKGYAGEPVVHHWDGEGR